MTEKLWLEQRVPFTSSSLRQDLHWGSGDVSGAAPDSSASINQSPGRKIWLEDLYCVSAT